MMRRRCRGIHCMSFQGEWISMEELKTVQATSKFGSGWDVEKVQLNLGTRWGVVRSWERANVYQILHRYPAIRYFIAKEFGYCWQYEGRPLCSDLTKDRAADLLCPNPEEESFCSTNDSFLLDGPIFVRNLVSICWQLSLLLRYCSCWYVLALSRPVSRELEGI